MELAHVVHRAATDPAFAAALQHNPATALDNLSVSLDDEKRAVLLKFFQKNPQWAAMCSPDKNLVQTIYWY
jgi:recombinational DNA repair ATPase RecF